ncbi:hypothetical protein M5D96_011654 [Drosophila gunungcola]|uniref:Uncharacterized protein n=1 Tax=Drosophila gunungcola TaxID=103775 RepID=A0A9P9YET1_9MUSC|nr:hypothetical protein M5D96_011654 [Drosophila gunungcola]
MLSDRQQLPPAESGSVTVDISCPPVGASSIYPPRSGPRMLQCQLQADSAGGLPCTIPGSQGQDILLPRGWYPGDLRASSG